MLGKAQQPAQGLPAGKSIHQLPFLNPGSHTSGFREMREPVEAFADPLRVKTGFVTDCEAAVLYKAFPTASLQPRRLTLPTPHHIPQPSTPPPVIQEMEGRWEAPCRTHLARL